MVGAIAHCVNNNKNNNMTPQEQIQLRLMSIEAAIRAGKNDALIDSASEIFDYVTKDAEQAKAKQAIVQSGTITPFERAPK